MKKFITAALIAALSAASLSASAATRMIRIHNADGTSALMSVAELQGISFLAPGVAGKGLTLNFTEGAPVAVLFSDEPAITFEGDCLQLRSNGRDEAVEAHFESITDITIGDVASVGTVGTGIVCRLSPGRALFTGIPQGVQAQVFTADGMAEAVFPGSNGELLLCRPDLPAGMHIVRIGSFTAKIIL